MELKDLSRENFMKFMESDNLCMIFSDNDNTDNFIIFDPKHFEDLIDNYLSEIKCSQSTDHPDIDIKHLNEMLEQSYLSVPRYKESFYQKALDQFKPISTRRPKIKDVGVSNLEMTIKSQIDNNKLSLKIEGRTKDTSEFEERAL